MTTSTLKSVQSLWRRHAWCLMAMVLSGVFLFLRFYHIQESLLFFNDIGRDFLELWKWEHTGKPPLLGPQTSALPFNQSAVYFYLLMPAYLLTGHSAFSTLYTCALVQIGLIWFGALWLHKHQPRWLLWFGVLILGLIIQPEMIAQQRFVWNPSFLAGWMMLALIASWQLVAHKPAQWSVWWLVSWGVGLSLAVSFSYSVAPAFLAVLILSLVWWRWQAWKLWLPVGVGLGLWNVPTVVFELRHGFLLTKMMLFGDRLPQPAADVVTKMTELSRLLIQPLWGPTTWQGQWWAWLGMGLWIGVVMWVLITQVWQWQRITKRAFSTSVSPIFIWTASWWLLTLGITLMVPVAVQSHYIFPLLVLGVASLVTLPSKWKWLIVAAFLVPWLWPTRLMRYWQPAQRSLTETQNCMQHICQSLPLPLFVSVQASYHPYHNGMEFQYLLRAAGCNMRDIETQSNQANHMVVMVDNSTYDHGQTAYRELTLFGPSQVEKTITCSQKLQAIILKRL